MHPDSQLIEDLVDANRILAKQGVVDGYGHVSNQASGMPLAFRILAIWPAWSFQW